MYETQRRRAANFLLLKTFTIFTVILLSVLAVPQLLVAQIGSVGQISGTVRDQSGAVVRGASVLVTNPANEQSRSINTDASGSYVVTNLPPGIYDLTAEQTGFKKFQQKGLRLDPAGKLTVDITLEVGSETQIVEVSANAAQVDQTSAQIGRVIDGNQVEELPLNSRNPIYLPVTKPGVVGASPNTFNLGTGNGNLNVNGNRGNANSILLDGVELVRTRSGDFNAGEITVDTVDEVNVLTASYAPEFGRASGGQTLFVTKSGGRQFHGSVWEFVRNDMFDANSWANNHTVPQTKRLPFKFNQPGYTIGGPVFIPNHFNTNRDKLFFFWSQEWSIRHQGTNTGAQLVPSDLIRAGNISEFGPGPDGIWGTHDDPIKNPATCAGGSSSAACVGFASPDLRSLGVLSPNGLALVNAYPRANCIGCFAGSNFFATGVDVQQNRKDVLRLDYAQGMHRLSLRYSGLWFHDQPAFAFGFGATRDWPWHTYSAGINLSTTLRPNLVNEFSIGAAADIATLGFGGTVVSPASRSAAGITYPYIFGAASKLAPDKIPTVNISTYSQLNGGPYPGRSAGVVYTWTDALSWIHDRHTFKFGVNIERSGENDEDQVNIVQVAGATNNTNGTFTFSDGLAVTAGGTGSTAGTAVVNALLGNFSTYGEIGAKSYTPWRATGVEWFAQDSWKMRSNFTLEYGARFDWWPPEHSMWNNIATFDPRFYQPGLASICVPPPFGPCSGPGTTPGSVILAPGSPATAYYNGMVLPGSGFPSAARGRVVAANDPTLNALFHNLPSGFSNTNFAVDPRLGFAWAINEKTALRAHAGVFHNRVLLNDSTLLGGNPPLQLQVSVSNGKADNPSGTGKTAPLFPLVTTAQARTLKAPTVYEWSVSVQRQLPASLLLELAYVGNRGNYLQRQIDLNALTPGPQSAAFAHDNTTGVVTGFQTVGAVISAARPFVGFGGITEAVDTGSSRYNSLQASLTRRFANGVGLSVAYTYSKSLDNASGYRQTMPNPFSDRDFWGPSDFDTRQVLAATYFYDLPFGHGRRWLKDSPGVVDTLLGGWQLSGISYLRSGTPFSIGSPVDALGVGGTSGTQLVQITGPVKVVSDPKVGQQYFTNPTAFTLATPGTDGNERRNQFHNPGYINHDMALHKNFQISETFRLQFRAEAFNFINHPNLNGPNGGLSGSGHICTTIAGCTGGVPYGSFATAPGTGNNTFGIVASKDGDRRNLQLGLKLTF